MTCDTRVWMHRKGESRLFAHAGLVPEDEGWQRFPLAVVHGPGSDRDLTDLEKLDRMSRGRLRQVASDCGIGSTAGWTKAQLKDAIIEVLNDNGA